MKFYSIKTRLTAIYAAIIVFFIVCVSLVVELLSSNALIRKSVLSADRELRLVEEKLDLFAENIETQSLYLIQVQNDLSFKDPYQNFLYTSGVLSFLQDFVHVQPSVESIAFYDARGNNLFSDSNSKTANVSSYEKPAYIEAFIEGDQNMQWIDFHSFQPPTDSRSTHWVCSFLRKIYSYSGEYLGIFELNINEESLQSIYDTVIADDFQFYIMNHEQMVVSAKDKTEIHITQKELEKNYPPEPLDHIFHSSEKYLYSTIYTNENLKWTLISILPMNAIMGEIRKLLSSIFLVGFFAVLSAFLLLRYITDFISRPLIELTSTVKEIAKGDYTIHADTSISNEIGILAEQINVMSENTLNLLNKIETQEALKRQFELSYIQLQMTPHFLYNTLESICGMIAVDEKKKAIRMIQNLSSFYRKILSRGAPVVTMKQELEITRCYLDILQQRYREAYTYEIEVDPQAEDYCFPKLTLQPFVENALIHGILPTGVQGELRISVTFQQERLLITITDNGRGIPADILQRLRTALEKRYLTEEMNFGIISTFQRLSLFLNEPDIDIRIDSALGKGTAIQLNLPAAQHDRTVNFSASETDLCKGSQSYDV